MNSKTKAPFTTAHTPPAVLGEPKLSFRRFLTLLCLVGLNELRFERYRERAFRLSATLIPASMLYSSPAPNNSILCWKREDVTIILRKVRFTCQHRLCSVNHAMDTQTRMSPDQLTPQNVGNRHMSQYFSQQFEWKDSGQILHRMNETTAGRRDEGVVER